MKNLMMSFCFLTLFACSSTNKAPTGSDGKAAIKDSVLTREQAMHRSKQVQRITYNLWFGLDENEDGFQGRTTIRFDLKDRADEFDNRLRIDFTGGKIHSLMVNGEEWDAQKTARIYDSTALSIRLGDLLKGQNRIEIHYSHPWSTTGNGLYRYKDPVDQKIYLYTNFEPYYANQLFPCFDQPDLKASYEITAEAPEGWNVISNMAERSKSKVDGRVSWQFAPSPVFSTYLVALHAGPYKMWKADADGVPMHLFARQSVAKNVDAQNWFDITRKGLKFFGEYFGYPYPYSKYDQILAPDFNVGAMENIGAVTFTENFIFRGQPTATELMDRADTILHEMAHMWFGDLVTMRWWNGLWLNESFATYLAHLAIKNTKLFPGADSSFFSSMKRWAYTEDQSEVSHPIEVSVPDTAQAFANFDGITYGKGASALKQLHYWIGDADFKEGLHRYFTKFANRNTVLADFIASLSQASEQNLQPWQKSWLQTLGYDRIRVELKCDANKKIESLVYKRTAAFHDKTQRPHRFLVGFYDKVGGALVKRADTFQITLDKDEAQEPEVVGKKCPAFVFPNENDNGFFTIEWDEAQQNALMESIATISEPLVRQMAWFELWEQTKQGKLSVTAYIDTVLKNISKETNKVIFEDVLNSLAHQHPARFTALRALNSEQHATYYPKVWKLLMSLSEKAAGGSDRQKIAIQAAMKAVHTPESAEWAVQVLTNKKHYAGFKLDPDTKWDLLQAAAGVKKIDDALLTKLKTEDTSSEAMDRIAQITALQSESNDETLWMDLYASGKTVHTAATYSAAQIRKSARAFLHVSRPERLQAWLPRYYENLKDWGKNLDDETLSTYVSRLYPGTCDGVSLQKTSDWLDRNSGAPTPLIKELKLQRFFDQKCVAAKSLK